MTQPQTIRFLILGLPAGLIITGVFAMFLYFHLEEKETQRTEHVRVRRAVNAEDLEEYVATLAGRVGERSDSAPQGLKSALKYLQSTLGPANLGYRVSMQEFSEGETVYHNLIVDLPGTDEKRHKEVVIVGANYDTPPGTPGAIDNASGTAALMSLAEAFAGTVNLRLVAFAADAPPRAGSEKAGSAQYAKFLKKYNENVIMMFSLESMARARAAEESGNPATGPAGPVLRPSPAAAGRLAEWLSAVKTRVSVPVPIPLLSPTEGRAFRSFAAEGFPAVRVTEEPDPLAGGASDTVDRLDYQALAVSVRAVEEILKEALNPAPEGVK